MRCTQLFSLLLVFSFIQQPVAQTPRDEDKGLKDYYAEFFPVGASVGPRSIRGDEAVLILKHFNSLTAENVMKMGPIHPEEDRYNWQPADAIVDFAQENGLRVRGHTLCWHNQTPDWIFVDSRGDQVAKDVLLARLEKHITEVVTRYKGKIYAWDVVNEAINNSGEMYRESPWYEICGKEYITKAFEFAHKADPDALLFYNDYNCEKPEKREWIYQLVKELKEDGVPIHGVGIQGHWSVYEPSEEDIRETIEKFSELGLQIQITELDVSVYMPEGERREIRPDESDEFTPEMETKQVEQYRTIFEVLRDYRDVITGVTFWNVSDKYSWLDFNPVRGRKNYPLLFDENYQPKKAYWEVINF